MVFRLLMLLLLTLIALPLSGCERQASSPAAAVTTAEREPVHVLASVYVLADIARQIGGNNVEVEWYVENGQSLDELVESPERRNQFRAADIVVTRGAADPWTLEGVGNVFQDRKILRIDALPSTREGDPTQYMWLDPRTAIEVANELTTRLSTLKPKSETTFKANAAKFTRHVADLMEQTSAVINRAGGGPFVTMDRGFLPLARRFGMTEVRPPVFSVAQPSEYDVKKLREAAQSAGAGAVYFNSQTPGPLLRDWQERMGDVKVLTLDPLGTSAPTGRSTYLAVLRYNLEQLQIGASRARVAAATTTTTMSPPSDAPAESEDAPILPRPPAAPASRPGENTAPPRKVPSPANPFEPVR